MAERIELVAHLSAAELFERYRAAEHPVERSHLHIIWLLACGRGVAECAAASGYSPRWVQKLARRYNATGPAALGDRRLDNRGAKRLLDDDELAELAAALDDPPPDGGLWSGPKVARWIAAKTGRPWVHPQRGWEYLRRLGYRRQTPRPRHDKTASPQERAAFKKNSAKPWRGTRPPTPRPRSRSGPSMSSA